MQRQAIEQLLPSIYRAPGPGTPLDAVLEIAAALPQPVEELLGSVDDLFDPLRAPEELVPYLARWVDLDRFLVTGGGEGARTVMPSGLGRLRELCACAAELSRLRGTRQGLQRFLEVATGVNGFRIEENSDADGREKPFHLRLVAPEAAREYEALIHAIVAFEKPAHVSYTPEELRFE
ncbi:phage tail protein [Marinimicrobium locisalis]|uniref:phage tail protein n=1 Tax=Marinimicrobium locisalis TaxID=546022 RepID=UPI003221BA87